MGTLSIFCNEGVDMVHRKVNVIYIDMVNKAISFEGTIDKEPKLEKWTYPVTSFQDFTVVGLCRFEVSR